MYPDAETPTTFYGNNCTTPLWFPLLPRILYRTGITMRSYVLDNEVQLIVLYLTL